MYTIADSSQLTVSMDYVHVSITSNGGDDDKIQYEYFDRTIKMNPESNSRVVCVVLLLEEILLARVILE